MQHCTDGDKNDAVKTERRALDLPQAWLIDECGHKQAGRNNGKDGADALERAAPTSRLSHQVCSKHHVEQTAEQDVDVAGTEQHSGHVGHTFQVSLIDSHILAGQKKDDDGGNTEHEVEVLQGGLL